MSRLERGLGSGASLATWSRVAAAVGEQLVGFLEHAPGADRPRDLEHLKRQSALIAITSAGGWVALPELAIDRDVARSRSIDVALIRRATREAVVVEIWDWFDDVGAGLARPRRQARGPWSRLAWAAPPASPGQIRGFYVVAGHAPKPSAHCRARAAVRGALPGQLRHMAEGPHRCRPTAAQRRRPALERSSRHGPASESASRLSQAADPPDSGQDGPTGWSKMRENGPP